MDCTVVIAERREKYVAKTVRDILNGCGSDRPDVLVVSDEPRPLATPDGARNIRPWKKPRGCQAARDRGIREAATSVVVIVDGHMAFDRGLFAEMTRYVLGHPNHVACACVGGLNPETWEPCGAVYHGANVVLRLVEKGMPNTPLALKWRPERDCGPVRGVLGACYAFSREWYVDGLGAPWSGGTGWGCDEETLSLTNWLSGGETVVLPVTAHHWYRTQGNVPYRADALAVYGQWANRLRLIKSLPLAPEQEKELTDHLWSNGSLRTCRSQIESLVDFADCAERRARMAKSSRTWEDFCSLPGVSDTVDSAPVPFPPRQKPTEPIAAATFSTRKPPEDNRVVVDPGIRCVHCSEAYGHTVTNTYPNGRRRMLCGSCGRPFVAQRVL